MAEKKSPLNFQSNNYKFLIHFLPEEWAQGGNVFNALGQSNTGFSEVLLEPMANHIPTLYAIHIWNNIPGVG